MIVNFSFQQYAKTCNEFYALFKESYLKYIGIINPVKLILPYKEYIYCSSSRWIKVKKYQLRQRLNNVAYRSVEFSQWFLFELLSTIAYYESTQNR